MLALSLIAFGFLEERNQEHVQHEQAQTNTPHTETERWTIHREENGSYSAEKHGGEHPEGALPFWSAEDWVAIGTIALVFATVLLFGATFALYRKTGEAVKDATEASKRQAGEFEAQLAIAKTSADAALKQVNAFIEMERPRFAMRGVFLKTIASDSLVAEPILPTTRLPLKFALSLRYENVGRTPAEVESIKIGWCVLPETGAPPNETPRYTMTVPFYPGYFVKVGEFVNDISERPENILTLNSQESTNIDAGSASLWVFAETIFTAPTGDSDGIRFCGRWRVQKHQPLGMAGGFVVDSNCPEIYVRRSKA